MLVTAIRICLLRTVAAVAIVGVIACSPSGQSDSARLSDSSRVVPAHDVATPSSVPATRDTATLVVYKSPTCGCCAKWVSHMEAAGFRVVVHDTEDMDAVKSASDVPLALRACHTAVIGRYVIEGHVPADDIRRLLRDRPDVAGLAVPGMPGGSPGMEGAGTERYDVVTFGGPKGQRVFASH